MTDDTELDDLLDDYEDTEDSGEDDEPSGDSDRFDVEGFDDDDSIVCPMCGELAWLEDGEYVCQECGTVSEDE